MSHHYASAPGVVTIRREITVAAGVFAPGHLGALTAVVPFDLVDGILERVGGLQRRLRALPSRVGVYFLLAMCLFPEVGYRLVWRKLTAALVGVKVADPTAKALRDVRRRIGVAPVQALFDALAGPVGHLSTPGVGFAGYRTVSFDGCCSIKVPDTADNAGWTGQVSHGGYPTVELMTLVETGTRALIGATFGPTATGETAYARTLLHLLTPGMLVLWDKGFDGNDFLAAVAGTGAQFLGRLNDRRVPPVLQALPDGSHLSRIGALTVRIVTAQITVACADGTRYHGRYRLATTLTDHRAHPAADLVHLYHERWEHESAYYALRHTLLHGRVLRSRDRDGLAQEIWALLCLYQALRIAMVTAAETRPGTDPDRISFTIALHTARDLLVQAAAVTAPRHAPGVIGQHLLDGLLPARRARVSIRKVKSPISRYNAHRGDPRPTTSHTITSLTVTILQPPDTPPPLPSRTRDNRHLPANDQRVHQVTRLLDQDPTRIWSAQQIARHLGDITINTMRRQLQRWSTAGRIQRVGPARYTAHPHTPHPTTHPTPPQNP